MTKTPEIVLKAGTRTIVVSEIPVLMARALYPDIPEWPMVLSYIDKECVQTPGTERRSSPQRCTEEDMALLKEILGTEPRLNQEFTENEWFEYCSAFEQSPGRPSWNMSPVWIGPLCQKINQLSAEEKHEAALKIAIRAGSFVPLDHARLALDTSIREALHLGQVSVETFREYAKTFGILVRTKGVVVQDLAESISQESAHCHPEKWKDPTDRDTLRRTVVDAIDKHGWPLDGITGVLPFICAEIKVNNINSFSMVNDTSCTDVSLVQANPAQWYVTENAARYLLKAMLGFVNGTHGLQENIDDSDTLVTHQFKSIHYNNSEEPIWEEWAEYPKLTVRQAVPLIHGLNPKFFAAEGTALPPGRARKLSSALELFRVCSHRIAVTEAEDLKTLTPDEWLRYATARIWPVCLSFRQIAEARVATSNNSAVDASTEAVVKTANIDQKVKPQGWRNRDILATIKALGYDPLKLPPRPKNLTLTWVKSAVWEKLRWPPEHRKAFDNAWTQLRREKKICELEHPPS